MLKNIVSLFLVFFFSSVFSFAAKTYVIDIPAHGVLSYGSYEFGFKFFDKGNIVANVDFGVFKFLDVGLSWELDRFVGNDNIKVAAPALNIRAEVYEGSMIFPGISVGYNGQGTFVDTSIKGGFVQMARGLYLVSAREILFEGFMLNAGVNVNDFSTVKIYGFISTMLTAIKDLAYFMAEYDHIHYFSDARLNCGVRISLSENVDVDCIVKDCFGKNNDTMRLTNERVLRISHSGKF